MSFWRGKKVLLTGHTGFKGGWLALWLSSLGARVIGFSLRPAQPNSLFAIARVAEKTLDIDGDIRDQAALRSAILAHKPDIIVHMAAQALVHDGYRDPAATFATNLMGTVNLLEAAREAPNLRAVLIVTSDKCYEPHPDEGQPHREGDRLGGHDPYSASKACAELATAAYRRSYFGDGRAGIATARAGNVIGGGDFAPNRLVPDVVTAILRGEKANIRHPGARRPWQFVTEPLAGYMRLVERLWTDPGRFAHEWNFAPPPEAAVTVAELCDRLCAAWGQGAGWIAQRANLPPERRALTIDAALARKELGVEARVGTGQALSATVDWYKAWRSGADMQAVTLRQIAEYGALHPLA